MTTSSFALSQHLLIGEALKRARQKNPNKEGFVFGETRLTYSQMDNRATQLAGWLQSKGIKKGNKVGYILKNSITMVEVIFGVALSGGIGVPINFRLIAKEFEYIINNSDTKILIIDSEYADVIYSIRKKIPKVESIIVVNEIKSQYDFIDYNLIFEKQSLYKPCENLNDDDPVMILYTSGTTGQPKGVVLSHKNLYLSRLFVLWETNTPMFSKLLLVLPMFHVGAIGIIIKSCLINGTLVIHEKFAPESILKTIETEQINSITLIPSMWNFLFQVPNIEKYDLSSMKECCGGGDVCPLTLKKKIMSFFKNAFYNEAFGQTETSPTTASLNHEDAIRKPTSVGRAIIGIEIRVVDDDMQDVPLGKVGEIIYRGPTVMKEYYNNSEATEEAFKGGWFHSGDLAKMDEEKFIYVAGRKANMVISGGENIYPAEIENVLQTHPSILESAVIGVTDSEWGESIKAFIVLKPKMVLTQKAVIKHCTESLASYKKPKKVVFVKQLPRNASGKVIKKELKESSDYA